MFIFRHRTVRIIIILLVLAVIGRWWQGEQTRRKGDELVPIKVSDSSPEFVMVQIDGAVQKPGVYRITSDAHVMDLVFLAGGLMPEARLGKINLAKVLEDGDRIHVLGAIKPRKKANIKSRKKIE